MVVFVQMTLFVVTLEIGNSLDICHLNDTVIGKDSFIQEGVVRELRLYAMFDCAAKCVVSSFCKSFNFDPETHTCELIVNTSNSVNVMPKQGRVFSDIHHWPKSVTGSCVTKICPVNHQCEADRLGRPVCRQEVSGCGIPPVVSNTKVTHHDHIWPAVAVYKCADSFRSCDDNDTWRLTCEPSGTWIGKSNTCQRYRWVNHPQKSRFSYNLPCGARNDVRVKWIGTPLKNTRIGNSFVKGSDILFTFEILFKLFRRTKYLVINTRKHGVFGKQIVLSNFPFAIHRQFLLQIEFHRDQYEVKQNGTHLITLQNRFPGLLPETFFIFGHVKIHSVEIDI